MAFRFKLMGIPVSVHGLFVLMMVLLGASRTGLALAGWVVVAFVSILAHEMGHAMAFRALGRTSRIELHSLGGLTIPADTTPLLPRQSFAVSLAGPLVGLVLGGVFWWISRNVDLESGLQTSVVHDMVWANVVWSLFNLVPVLPLDGGEVLRSAVRAFNGDREPRSVYVVGVVVAALLAALGLYMQWLIAAFLMGAFALRNAALYKHAGQQAHAEQDRVKLRTVALLLEANRPDQAATQLEDLLKTTGDGETQTLALHALARARLMQGRASDALGALQALPAGARPDSWLLGAALSADGQVLAAVEVLRAGFVARPHEKLARELVVAMHAAGQQEALREWLGSEETLTWPDDICRGAADGLFKVGMMEEALAIQGFRYKRDSVADAAHQAARACARLGRIEDANTWLVSAVKSGFRDLPALEADDVLAPVRASHGFASTREMLAAS